MVRIRFREDASEELGIVAALRSTNNGMELSAQTQQDREYISHLDALAEGRQEAVLNYLRERWPADLDQLA